MKKVRIFLVSVILILMCVPPCMGAWKELGKGEPIIPEGPGGIGSCSFLCRHPDGNLFYADEKQKLLRVKRPDGSVLEFNSKHLRGTSITAKAHGNDAIRHKWYGNEPVIWGLSNMKCFEKGVVLFHREGVPGRAVQFIDENLQVIRTWEDKTLRCALIKPEAVAVTADGEVIACGEKGEMLKYDLNGNVVKRFIFPGIFNESRIVEPEPIPEGYMQLYSALPRTIERRKEIDRLDALIATKRVAKRDNILPEPIFLSGPEMPSFIKALEITGDNTILLMDDSKIYEIDQDTATIQPLNITGLVFSKDEKLRGMRVRDDYLLLITKKRALSIDINEKSIIGERERDRQLTYTSWDVIPPRTFLLAGVNNRAITKYVCTVPRHLLKSRKLSKEQLKSKVLRLGEHGLEKRNDGLYYEPSGTEPFSGSVRILDEKGNKEILTNYLYGMEEGEKIELWDQGDGKVYTKWTYKDNILHGEYKKWEEGGCVWIQGNYKNGRLDGPYAEWFSSGRKSLVGTYKDGRKEGIWIGWHRRGFKMFEVSYKDGRKFGLCLSWYPNGQKKRQYQFNEKGYDGEWIYWDERGNITEKKVYKDGKLIESFKP